MGDILFQQDFLHTGLKMSVLGLNTQLIDVVKDVLVAFKDPKAVLKVRENYIIDSNVKTKKRS